MTADTALLQRVRKLLAKAEADGATPAEAEAFTVKAAELMARYGIDRALLAAAKRKPTGRPTASSMCPILGPRSRRTCSVGLPRPCVASAFRSTPDGAARAFTSSATPLTWSARNFWTRPC